MALELIKQQEITKAAEHQKQSAEYAAYVKQMEVLYYRLLLYLLNYVCMRVSRTFITPPPPLFPPKHAKYLVKKVNAGATTLLLCTRSDAYS